MKNDKDVKIDFDGGLEYKKVIKHAVNKFGGHQNQMKIYNKSGVLLFEEDFNLINPYDVLYVALAGEVFNYCAILDDYDLGRTLGVGGFGKVLLAKHKENKNLVAIKFTDVGS